MTTRKEHLMKMSTILPATAALAVGYVLGSAAGRGRYRQITTAATTAVHHPRFQQLLFDLAGRASINSSRIPGPAADLVDTAATHVQDTLTQPDHEPVHEPVHEADREADGFASAPAEPIFGRHVA